MTNETTDNTDRLFVSMCFPEGGMGGRTFYVQLFKRLNYTLIEAPNGVCVGKIAISQNFL